MLAAPDQTRLFDVLDATWPAAAQIEAGPWCLREGRGGGKRVSTATPRGPWQPDDLAAAEKAMRLMGQAPLFRLAQGDLALDAALAAQGYAMRDAVDLWLAPIGHLTDRRLPRVTAFAIWEPLAIMRELWDDGGIGPARRDVMERVRGPKTAVFGRVSDRPAGAAFCAISDGIAMVHALHILPAHRGKGLGSWMMRCAALWAKAQGARWIAVAVTSDNVAARALYASLRMEVVAHYHYRILEAESEKP